MPEVRSTTARSSRNGVDLSTARVDLHQALAADAPQEKDR